jgi:hypothetical protein
VEKEFAMLNIVRKGALAAAMAGVMAAGTLAAVPAQAGNHMGDPGGAWPYYDRHHHHHWHRGNDWVGPLIGGMVIGGILAAPYYGYAPPRQRYYGNHDAYCHARFRSYNSYTGMYLGYDGRYHRC